MRGRTAALLQLRFGLGHPPIDLGDGFDQHRPPPFMRRDLELAPELRARESKRLDLLHDRGIACVTPTRFLPGLLDLVAALLNPCVRVDQSFPGITHANQIHAFGV